MAAVDRILPPISRTWRVAGIGLALVLLVSLVVFPSYAGLVRPLLPIVSQWRSPDAQYRALLPDIPYDLLRAADASLPRDAAVLLITPGDDVEGREYRIFHRALYFLAPRPVWWLTAAAPDGTWKSRWRMSAPLSAEAIRAIAAEKQVSYALVYGVSRAVVADRNVVDLGDGYVIQLDERRPLLSARSPRTDALTAGWPIWLALSIVIILLLGSTALMIIARSGYRARGIENAALSWVLGAGLTSTVMLWVDAMGGSLRTQMMVVASLAVSGSLWMVYLRLRAREPANDAGYVKQSRGVPGQLAQQEHSALLGKRHGSDSSRATRSFLLPCILLGFLILQVLYITVFVVGKPLDIWDSWVTWGMKARIIFLDGSISPAVYADPSRAITHLDYPLLLPLIQAWLYGWLGTPDDRLVGTLAVLFYLALAGVCYSAVRRRGGTGRFAVCVAVAVVSLPQIAQLSSNGFADVPLATCVTIAAIYLIEWLDGGPPGALIIAAAAGGLMPWTKREGLVLLAVLGLAVLLAGRGARRAWLGAAGLLLGAAVLAGPWWGFIAWKGIANTDFLPITLATWQANIGRLPKIVGVELAWLFSPDWGFVWPIAALTGLFARRAAVRTPGSVARRTARLLPIAALLYLGLISPMFVFSAFVPFEGHVLSSVYRLIAQVVPLPVLWMAYRECEQS